ncbi:tRNA-intron lyase [Candidatus Woesearchaeota archaeon]|jgi:tRNA-intron endonuclease, archaea type|nr:tRNA-intron lyase [Candidatus Woesearchaeota archaeon]MBT4322173.1 tRNA-intron lyase [Candidatus Woesearchaeota archaeon]MBT4630921.1 tRNA-intron lyase [Candidatus Woesearchaeota archaeon]
MDKDKIVGKFEEFSVVALDSPKTRSVYDKSRFGELKYKKFRYSLSEALYLIEKGLMDVVDGKNKAMKLETFVKKARKLEPRFWTRYSVYKDMRGRGYIVKTALKFGADFRVYDRGVKPGEDHAKWVMYAVHEGESFSWYEFSAKNRVAHSTRKNLLIAIVDDEGDVTYYNVNWERP